MQTIEGRGIEVEIEDPHGLVIRWQRYGRDRLFLKGLKGVYIGLDDGNVPRFNNPAYHWGCEELTEGQAMAGYHYWYRHFGGVEASVLVRFRPRA